jgi:hypothetical protein
MEDQTTGLGSSWHPQPHGGTRLGIYTVEIRYRLYHFSPRYRFGTSRVCANGLVN